MYPEMNGVSQSGPFGENQTDSLEAVFQRRMANGFTVNASFTGLYERARDFFDNEFDASPSWRQTNNGVPYRFTATGIYELPFGKTKMPARAGVWNVVFGGWQVAAAYEWQPGPRLDWGNVFCTGDPANINTGTRTLDRWFNTDGFVKTPGLQPAAFQARVFPQRVDGLRADRLDRLDTSNTSSTMRFLLLQGRIRF